jgi:uncharacterized protein
VPEYLTPGVYVEETSFRSKSIEGVSTSTTAFAGPTRRGPVVEDADTKEALVPEVITSFGEFARVYGGIGNLSFDSATDADPQITNYMAHAVKAFFDNGGARLYVARTFTPRSSPGGSDGYARSRVLIGAGQGEDDQVQFVARQPGSGLNCTLHAVLRPSKASKVTLDSAPLGAVVRTGGSTPAKPAFLPGNPPPFTFKDGDQLVLTLPGGEQTITFQGSSATVTGADVDDTVTIPTGTTLEVTIDNRPVQVISLPDNSQKLADLATVINEGLRGGYAGVVASANPGKFNLVIGSDTHGLTAKVVVNNVAALGLTTQTQSGHGNVQDLDNVSVDEINSLLTAGTIPVHASLAPTGGQLRLETTATGPSATLAVAAATTADVRNEMGLLTAGTPGVAGTAVQYYSRRNGTWNGTGGTTLDLTDTDKLKSAELVSMTLIVTDADGNEIGFDNLGLSPKHPRWAGEILKQTPSSKADALLNPVSLKVGKNLLGSADLPNLLQEAIFASESEVDIVMTGGNDGAEPVSQAPTPVVKGTASFQQALQLLEKIEDISILAAPGYSATVQSRSIQNELINHVENKKYCIAILDTPPGLTPGGALDERSQIDTTRAAMYYPWVIVNNLAATPRNDLIPKEIALPPSGFVAGIYARTDITRGVWKAPANEVVRGALRFETDISFGQQGTLNPQGLNCLRFFYGRGYRVWGARTASSDPEWKYVNVRRYFIYLERSIDRSTQWAVFEPNGENLWANIRETVSAFLYNEWRNGALLGSKPEEAYFVRCDRSTMTQNDLDNGRLICMVGVAALKPAEFVIFRIGQKTADARS